MKFQLGTMTVGDILDRGIKILFSRFGTFLGINLLILLPVLAVQLSIPMLLEIAPIMIIGGALIAVILLIILGQVVAGATIQVIAKEYVGEPVSAGSAISYAFGRVGALIGTSIMAGLVILL